MGSIDYERLRESLRNYVNAYNEGVGQYDVVGVWSLSRENPLNALGMQVAFGLGLTLPLVGAAALYRLKWFYPALMIALGAHYLPFVFLYGMRLFAVLTAILVTGGVVLGMYLQGPFATGAWFTAVVRWCSQCWDASRFGRRSAVAWPGRRAAGRLVCTDVLNGRNGVVRAMPAECRVAV